MNTPPAPNRKPAAARAPEPEPTWADDLEDALLALAPYLVGAGLAALAFVGALVVAAAQPAWLSQLMASLAGVTPKAYWYLSRSSAIIGYFMLWGSMVLGLAITNKMARAWPGGPTYAALHEHTGWLGLVLSIFHALVLLGDGYIGYNLTQILVPFASTNYLQLWVGLGQIAIYLMAFVVVSFYLKRWISYKLWRTLHYLSFAVFALGMVHGLMSGTDSAGLSMLMVYWVSAVSVVGLIIYRIQRARAKIRPQRQAAA